MYKNFLEKIDFLKAYLIVGEKVEKISSCTVKRKFVGGISYYAVNDKYFIKNFRCSCDENLCWHLLALKLKCFI